MSTERVTESAAAHAQRPAFVRKLVSLENGVLALVLGAIVLVPIAETLLRSLFKTGISGSTTIVQHLTLLVGMFGGAVAARESRMLALSTVDTFLKGRVRDVLHCLTYGFAAAVAAFLCVAGVLWIQTEIPTGTELVYGIPAWIVQSVLPFGFALVAIRLAWSAGRTWRGRVVAWVIVGSAAALVHFEPVDPEKLVTPGLVALA